MNNVTRRTLRVYAALSELKGGDNDVLDALIPFFEPILSVMDGTIFDPHVFSAGVRKVYRWRFTGDIAATFIPRLERKGFLRKGAKTTQGNVWLVQYSEQREDGAPQTILVALEQIIDEFIKFPPRVTDLLTYRRSRDELKDILLRFLVLMDTQGEGAYAPELGGLEPGGEASRLLSKLEEGGTPLNPDDRYMCARFVQHLMKRRPEFVPHLVRLASIGLLAEVVEDFLKPTHVESKSDLTVILDAPIALDLLGCSGKALKDDISTVVAALRNVGVTFIVVPAICVEMQRNLRSMLALSIDQRRGYTHNAMIKREVSIEFVTAVANNPERALDNIGITVRPVSLDSFPNFHRYFTNDQYEDFLSSITWGNQIAAREHDATCTALVIRLRDGRQSGDVFKCRYVMATRNQMFVNSARKYCLQSRMINEVQEGPIIHQRELATTAWLRTGLGADETIPRGYLIATCDRVLQMRPEVRNALAIQLARITPERLEQFNLLMQDARSVQKLADQTLNNEELVTSENAEQLLKALREATAEELKEKHEAELQAERTTAQENLDKASSEINQLSDQLNVLKNRETSAFALKEHQLKQVVSSVNKVTFRLEAIVVAVLLVLGIAGCVNFFTGILDPYRIWSVILFLAGVLGFLRLVFAVLERPIPGLGTALNKVCKALAVRRLSNLGLPLQSDRLEYKGGRVSLAQQEVLVTKEEKIPDDYTPKTFFSNK
jgi:hypothetical protein